MSYAVIPSGPFDTNAYVLLCPKTLKAAIIDPAPESMQKIVSYLKEHHLIPESIWLTHSHWDHIADAASLIKKYNIPLSVHEDDAENVRNPGSDTLPCWITIEGVTPTYFFKDGEMLHLGNLLIYVIHTPGHSPGGVSFYLPQEKLLFSGDTLFKGTIGNLSFATARPALMWQSLEKLGKLPEDIKVLPGHGPETTIGREHWLKNAKNYFG